MSVLKVDKNSKWYFFGDPQNYISESDEVAQNCTTRLLEWKNNCFFNTTAGIYWNIRLGNPNQENLLRSDIQSVLALTPGVSRVGNIKFTKISNGLKIETSVQTIYSEEFLSLSTQIIY